MKRCPTCNQTFEEDWLSFCTHDGTTLIEAQGPSTPAVVAAPTQAATNDQATWNLSSAAPIAPPQPQPIAPAWKPPPPPGYAQPQSNGLATASMIVGIVSITCLGPLPGVAAIILGAVALSQMKKNPESVGGRPQAITGIVTGSLSVVIYAVIIIFYIVVVVLAVNQ